MSPALARSVAPTNSPLAGSHDLVTAALAGNPVAVDVEPSLPHRRLPQRAFSTRCRVLDVVAIVDIRRLSLWRRWDRPSPSAERRAQRASRPWSPRSTGRWRSSRWSTWSSPAPLPPSTPKRPASASGAPVSMTTSATSSIASCPGVARAGLAEECGNEVTAMSFMPSALAPPHPGSPCLRPRRGTRRLRPPRFSLRFFACSQFHIASTSRIRSQIERTYRAELVLVLSPSSIPIAPSGHCTFNAEFAQFRRAEALQIDDFGPFSCGNDPKLLFMSSTLTFT